MNKVIYPRQMKPSRFNDNQVLVYLNEEIYENYLPEDAEPDAQPYTAYAYNGEMADGGTLINATDMSRDALVNGIIRTQYSQTEEDAIKTHQILILQNPTHPKKSEWDSEWAQFCTIRQAAIDLVDEWNIEE